jgi:hypothetical protein
MTDWTQHSIAELLRENAAILRELRRRRVVRSTNNPVADLAETLAKRAFSLKLAAGANKCFDGTCDDGKKWQVKGRRLTAENQNSGLSVIRNLNEAGFDYLLAIYFDETFAVQQALRIEHAAVVEHGRFSKQQAGYVVRKTAALLQDARCVDVTPTVKRAARALTRRGAGIAD